MKQLFITLALMVLSTSLTQCQRFKLEGILEDYPDQSVYLLDFWGDQNQLIDSTTTNPSGYFAFNFDDSIPTGMYRLFFKNNSFVDVILDNKPVRILTQTEEPFEHMQVLESDENKRFYRYLHFRSLHLYKLDLLQPLIRFYPEKDSFYFQVKHQYIQIQDRLTSFTDSILQNHPTSFTSKIAAIEREPLLDPEYSAFEQNLFMKLHYFDNIGFDDTTLLRSNAISNKILGYLSLYQNSNLNKEQLEAEFIKAVDTLLSKTNQNRYIYEFVLDYLIGGFDKYNFNQVIEYIAEHSALEEFCEYTEKSSELEKRIETLKRLAIGNTAPDFETRDIFDNPITLSDIDKAHILLVFWASWCPHCNKVLPQLKSFYKENENADLDVIAVSLDTSYSEYQQIILDQDYYWINICDFAGWDNEIASLYGIYATPTMILLDRNRKIIAKPGSVHELKAALKD